MMNCGFVKAIFPRGRSRSSMTIANDINGNHKSFYNAKLEGKSRNPKCCAKTFFMIKRIRATWAEKQYNDEFAP